MSVLILKNTIKGRPGSNDDTFDLPHGSALLASTKLYKNQAFRFGENIYTLQFHTEVKNDMIYEWFKGTPDCKLILEETENVCDEYYGRAMNFYKAFFKKR